MEPDDHSRESSSVESDVESVEALDEELFQAFREVELQYARKSLSHDQLRVRYRAIADRFVPRYERAGAPDLAREVERSATWRVFCLLFDEGCTVEECEAAFAEVLALGFGSLDQEAHMLTVFCAYCARHGASIDMLKRYLEPLIRTLEQSGDPSWTFRQMCEDILARAQRGHST